MIFANKNSDNGHVIAILELHVYGHAYWLTNGEYHRLNNPAIIYSDGHRYWYQNGKFHRTNGPAVIQPNGSEEWWLNGLRIA